MTGLRAKPIIQESEQEQVEEFNESSELNNYDKINLDPEDIPEVYFFVPEQIKVQLAKVRKRVLLKDRDFVAIYDGEEGVGKSVLAMQHAKILDPNFNLDNVVFNADDFMKKIKDPRTKKGTCVVLDEAFNAANSRASLSEVNRAMIGLATEMRQKNLFVLLVLPTFFDLDKYFAIWRARALFHCYFDHEDNRRYVVFDKDAKKLLYLKGKKNYNYNYPKATFAPSRWSNYYVVDEKDYREKKQLAFQKRTVSNQAKNWLSQRNFLIKWMILNRNFNQVKFTELFKNNNITPLSKQSISLILKEMKEEGEIINEKKILQD